MILKRRQSAKSFPCLNIFIKNKGLSRLEKPASVCCRIIKFFSYDPRTEAVQCRANGGIHTPDHGGVFHYRSSRKL